MALKSLAEIAFDAFRCFSTTADKELLWTALSKEEKFVWERVAGRVSAEIALRRDEDEQ